MDDAIVMEQTTVPEGTVTFPLEGVCKVEVCSIHPVFLNVTSVSCKNVTAPIPPLWRASAG